MIKFKKEDGSFSKTMLWNTAIMGATGLFGIAVNYLPQIANVVSPEAYVGIALVVKTIDMVLRQVTTQPMAGK